MNFFSNRRQSNKERMLISKRVAGPPCDMTYNSHECVLYYPRNSVNLHDRLRNCITFFINVGSGTKEQTFILPSMDDIKRKLIMDNSYNVVSTRYTTINSRIRDDSDNQVSYHNQKTITKETNRRRVIPSINDFGLRYYYTISLKDTLSYKTQVYSRLLSIITSTGTLQAIAFLQ